MDGFLVREHSLRLVNRSPIFAYMIHLWIVLSVLFYRNEGLGLTSENGENGLAVLL